MANLSGGDAYFAKTIRNVAWQSFDADLRAVVIGEAESMIGRLAFARRPSAESADNAAYEQAMCLLQRQVADTSDVASAIAQGIKSRSVGDASESYTSAAEREMDPGWIGGMYYCPAALSWLSGCLGQTIRRGSFRAKGW